MQQTVITIKTHNTAVMMDEKPVWLPDAVEGYLLGKIVDIGPDQVTATTISAPSKVTQHL